MTTASPALMRKAHAILMGFKANGRPSPGDIKKWAAFQKSPVGWPVSRDALAAQLAARLNYTNTPRQLGTSYCGPAAFLYCVLEDRPDLYVEYAVQLWTSGRYNFRAKPGDSIHVETAPRTVAGAIEIAQRRRSGEQINDLDWMTMACLSASTRPLSGLRRGASPDDVRSSITYPWTLRQWFTAAGSPPSHDAMGWGALRSGLFPFINLMRFWRTHWIVLQIDVSFAQGGMPTFSGRHWVVVSPHYQPRTRRVPKGPMVPLEAILPDFWKVPEDQLDTAMQGRHLGGRELDMRLVTWGQEDYRAKASHLSDVEARYYGGYAFPRIR